MVEKLLDLLVLKQLEEDLRRLDLLFVGDSMEWFER